MEREHKDRQRRDEKWKRMARKEKNGAEEKKFRSSVENFLGEHHKVLLNK